MITLKARIGKSIDLRSERGLRLVGSEKQGPDQGLRFERQRADKYGSALAQNLRFGTIARALFTAYKSATLKPDG